MELIQMGVREVVLRRSGFGLYEQCSFQKQHEAWIAAKTEERSEATMTRREGRLSGGRFLLFLLIFQIFKRLLGLQ